jgi:hypothetical protein
VIDRARSSKKKEGIPAMLTKLPRDFFGLWRVCGPALALRWLGQIALKSPCVLREHKLNAADNALGEGPFPMRSSPRPVRLAGYRVVSAIREIWVRDVYIGEFLTLPSAGLVVELGANRGYFTAKALGGGPACGSWRSRRRGWGARRSNGWRG